MRLTLEFEPAQATLVVVDGGERVEVRGNPAVGATYTGDTLDRLVAGLPKTVDISGLFADGVVHLRPGDAAVVRLFLKEEDRLRALVLSSPLHRRGNMKQ